MDFDRDWYIEVCYHDGCRSLPVCFEAHSSYPIQPCSSYPIQAYSSNRVHVCLQIEVWLFASSKRVSIVGEAGVEEPHHRYC